MDASEGNSQLLNQAINNNFVAAEMPADQEIRVNRCVS